MNPPPLLSKINIVAGIPRFSSNSPIHSVGEPVWECAQALPTHRAERQHDAQQLSASISWKAGLCSHDPSKAELFRCNGELRISLRQSNVDSPGKGVDPGLGIAVVRPMSTGDIARERWGAPGGASSPGGLEAQLSFGQRAMSRHVTFPLAARGSPTLWRATRHAGTPASRARLRPRRSPM
jgi:hypothetical protein